MDFVGTQCIQRLKDSFFKQFLELSVGTLRGYREPEYSTNGAMNDLKRWADESVYKANAGVDSSGKPRYHITIV
jgi:hypothetical protein